MTTLKKFPLFHIFGTITFLVLGLLVNVAQVLIRIIWILTPQIARFIAITSPWYHSTFNYCIIASNIIPILYPILLLPNVRWSAFYYFLGSFSTGWKSILMSYKFHFENFNFHKLGIFLPDWIILQSLPSMDTLSSSLIGETLTNFLPPGQQEAPLTSAEFLFSLSRWGGASLTIYCSDQVM